jgi:hypothetical protein
LIPVILVATTGGVLRNLAVAAEAQGLIKEGKYIFISVDFYTQKRSFGDFGWKRVGVMHFCKSNNK